MEQDTCIADVHTRNYQRSHGDIESTWISWECFSCLVKSVAHRVKAVDGPNKVRSFLFVDVIVIADAWKRRNIIMNEI